VLKIDDDEFTKDKSVGKVSLIKMNSSNMLLLLVIMMLDATAATRVLASSGRVTVS
jgi:hypothetical protein